MLGLHLLDKEDFQATSYAFVGSAPRESRPAVCFKCTANASSMSFVKEDVGAEDSLAPNKPDSSNSIPRILPGKIISIGLTTTSMEALKQRIEERRHSLSSLLHLGRPLRLVDMQLNRNVHDTLKKMFPSAILMELCEVGKMAQPKIAVSLIGLEKDQQSE